MHDAFNCAVEDWEDEGNKSIYAANTCTQHK